MPTLACFISSHGFGHAARAAAILDACRRRRPDLRVELYTRTPAWFFADALGESLPIHPTVTDVGMVQKSALDEDLPATAERLRGFLASLRRRTDELAGHLARNRCDLVLCDVSPLGLAVADAAGLPSVLVESFTWSWIYRRYAIAELAHAAERFASLEGSATLRVQTEPVCEPQAAAVRVPPVSREPRTPRHETRRRLGIPPDEPALLVTMGGIEWDYGAIEERLAAEPDLPWLVMPGSTGERRARGRTIRLPHRSAFFHPDLIAAVDGVVGKLGYSTLAEVGRAGLPFGYVPRPSFPESPVLEAWVRKRLPHRRIDPQRFASGDWLDDARRLVRETPAAPGDNGAVAAAHALLRLLPHRGRGAAESAVGRRP